MKAVRLFHPEKLKRLAMKTSLKMCQKVWQLYSGGSQKNIVPDGLTPIGPKKLQLFWTIRYVYLLGKISFLEESVCDLPFIDLPIYNLSYEKHLQAVSHR